MHGIVAEVVDQCGKVHVDHGPDADERREPDVDPTATSRGSPCKPRRSGSTARRCRGGPCPRRSWHSVARRLDESQAVRADQPELVLGECREPVAPVLALPAPSSENPAEMMMAVFAPYSTQSPDLVGHGRGRRGDDEPNPLPRAQLSRFGIGKDALDGTAVSG